MLTYIYVCMNQQLACSNQIMVDICNNVTNGKTAMLASVGVIRYVVHNSAKAWNHKIRTTRSSKCLMTMPNYF